MAVRKDTVQIVIDIEAQQGVKRYQQLADKSKSLAREIKKLEKAGKENTKEYKALANQLEDVNEEFRELGGKGATMQQLINRAKQLNREFKNTAPNTRRAFDIENELKSVNSRLATMRKRTKGVAEGMSLIQKTFLAGGLLGALSAISSRLSSLSSQSLELFDIQAKSDAQLKATLASTNEIAGRTFEQLAAQADELQNRTLFGDEATQRAQALLLTFTNIREEIFDQTLPTVLDLATAMETDLKTASIQVGKALNDPVKGVSALAKSGIQFSDQQKKVIKDLVDTGQVAKAQTIILKELETQFGGSAEAAAQAGTGGITQLQNNIGDLKEEIGALVAEGMQILLPILQSILTGFVRFLQTIRAIPEIIRENRTTIIALGVALVSLNAATILAAANTLRLAIQSKAVAIATTAQTVAQNLLNKAMRANPIGLVVSALALLTAGFSQAYKRSQTFRASIAGLGALASEVFSIIKEAVGNFLEGWEQLKQGNVGAALKSFGKGLHEANPLRIAFFEGKRLKDAYLRGFNELKVKESIEELQDEIEATTSSPGSSTTSNSSRPFSGGSSSSSSSSTSTTSSRQTIAPLSRLQSIMPTEVESLPDYEVQQELLKSQFLKALITEQDYEEQRYKLQQASFDQRLELLKEKGQEESLEFFKLQNEKLEAQQAFEQERLELTKRTEEARKAALTLGLNQFEGFVDNTIALLKEEEKERGKSSLALKAFSAGKVAIDGVQEVQAIWKTANENPLNALFPGAGATIAVLKTAASVARTQQALKKIGSVGFYTGGYTGNANFGLDGQGRAVAGLVHKNEWVAPEWQVNHPEYGPLINYLEQGRMQGYVEGGFTSANTTPSLQATNAIQAASPSASVRVLTEVRNDIVNSNRYVAQTISKKQFQIRSGQLVEALDDEAVLESESTF